MIELETVTTVVIDIVGMNTSRQMQEEFAETAITLLNREYHLVLVSTGQEDDLASEDFSHPNLEYISDEMPPTQETLEKFPKIKGAEALWLTDNSNLIGWLREMAIPQLALNSKSNDPGFLNKLGRLSDLVGILDPSGQLMSNIVRTIEGMRQFQNNKTLVIGIGGPPMSQFEQFALDLRGALAAAEIPLVELFDVGSVLKSCDEMAAGPNDETPWREEAALNWVREALMHTIREGEPFYAETRPEALSEDYDPYFPFFISQESVLICFGEMIFTPPLSDSIDLEILLEMKAEENARRLYEIPYKEHLDPQFIAQFLDHEGKVYNQYLEHYRVIENASIRIDANSENVFKLISEPSPKESSPV